MKTVPQTDFQTKLINEHEAADYIGHSVRGGGPRFVKISGRSIRYRRCDLNEWIEARLVRSTSDVVGEAANDA